ncbi:MAG: NmrA family protein [Thermomicrobium sp.]|uniref:NmrA family protein n=1 Tax=Thermomicrobium sp. TaxID=1969469 RepID=UPI001B0B6DEC|nr:NmrA family protein [Thermomicrobium sp.]MBO9359695.1 NmrA family protein [Thermomicrobium sp.]
MVARARDLNRASDLAAQGITVRPADYDDPARLNAALRGIQRLLLISGSEVGRRVQQHRNVIVAAVRASSSSPTRASSTPTARRSAS